MTKHTLKARPLGFTLIELMITVAIIGILAAIAYPSYISHVRKAKRVDAKSLLLQAANREESLYTASYKYSSSMKDLGLDNGANTNPNGGVYTDNKAYTVNVSNVSADNQHFTLTATAATTDQAKDPCYLMTLADTGLKTAQNASGADTTATCW